MVGDTMNLFAETLEIKKIVGVNIAVYDTSINVVNPTKSSICSTFQMEMAMIGSLYRKRK